MYDLRGVFMATLTGIYDKMGFNDTLFIEMNTFSVFTYIAQLIIYLPILTSDHQIKCREHNSHGLLYKPPADNRTY